MEGKKLAGTILSASCKTLIFVLVALALYFIGRSAYRFGNSVFNEQAATSLSDAYEVEITIPEDYTVKSVGKQLEEAGLIESAGVFYVQARLSDYFNDFTPGTYVLNSTMKPSEIITAISVKTENAEE